MYIYIYMKYDTKIGIDHRSKGPVHLWLRVDDLDPGRLDPWLFSSGTLKRSGTGPNRWYVNWPEHPKLVWWLRPGRQGDL